MSEDDDEDMFQDSFQLGSQALLAVQKIEHSHAYRERPGHVVSIRIGITSES